MRPLGWTIESHASLFDIGSVTIVGMNKATIGARASCPYPNHDLNVSWPMCASFTVCSTESLRVSPFLLKEGILHVCVKRDARANVACRSTSISWPGRKDRRRCGCRVFADTPDCALPTRSHGMALGCGKLEG